MKYITYCLVGFHLDLMGVCDVTNNLKIAQNLSSFNFGIVFFKTHVSISIILKMSFKLFPMNTITYSLRGIHFGSRGSYDAIDNLRNTQN